MLGRKTGAAVGLGHTDPRLLQAGDYPVRVTDAQPGTCVPFTPLRCALWSLLSSRTLVLLVVNKHSMAEIAG